MSELQGAVLVFVIGALVTLATVVMIARGHARWHGRNPYDDPGAASGHDY